MARLMYGGGIADWSMSVDSGTKAVSVVSGAVITFWDQRVGGTQYADLETLGGDEMPQVVTDEAGAIPVFMGPDNVFEMWASANGGPRMLMTAANIGSHFGPMRAQLEAHISSGNVNPHNSTVASMRDVAGMDSKEPGQVLAIGSDGLIRPTTVTGVGGTVQLAGDQTVSGTKTHENQQAPAAPRQVINAAEGQTADVFQVWSPAAAGQGGAKVKTAAFNARGEARLAAARADSVAVQVAGQAGQTANVLEQVNASGAVISRMEANGAWRAPNLGRSLLFAQPAGTSAVNGPGTFSWFNDTGVPLTIRSARASAVTAPAGAALIVDVNVNGTSIFSTQANRPTIATGAKTSGRATGFSTAVIPDGASVTVDIDQIGTTSPGAGVYVQVEVY